jgi:hypothetical protein
MMTEYFPDNWQVIEIKTPESTIQKVLASWWCTTTWRLSSGITEAVENEGHYLFHNESGSIYKCFKDSQGMSAYTTSVYQGWLKDLPEGTTMTIEEY